MENPSTDTQGPHRGRSLSTGTKVEPSHSFECFKV